MMIFTQAPKRQGQITGMVTDHRDGVEEERVGSIRRDRGKKRGGVRCTGMATWSSSGGLEDRRLSLGFGYLDLGDQDRWGGPGKKLR